MSYETMDSWASLDDDEIKAAAERLPRPLRNLAARVGQLVRDSEGGNFFPVAATLLVKDGSLWLKVSGESGKGERLGYFK